MLIHPMVQVGQHRCAIDSDPVEQIMGKYIRIIPAELGSHEILHSAVLQNLRERSAVSERIRQPFDAGGSAELLAVESLAV
ncbi:hypothetical protein D3C73_367780 [compost metagenome]